MQKEHEALNTPAMKQFLEIKSRYPEGILFFRMGDFYEMFMEDAIVASSILDIALTKRQNQIPMCGIPCHATESYISRLLGAGKSVVICEQMKQEGSKLMAREVVRVITPGTVVEENLIRGFENNFLCFIYFYQQRFFVIFADITTSEMFHFALDRPDRNSISTLFEKFPPTEILVYKEQILTWENLEVSSNAVVTLLDSTRIPIPKSGELSELKNVLDHFLKRNFKDGSFQFPNSSSFKEDEYLVLDYNTIKNLDLVENQNPGEKEHSLFHVLNHCVTSGGKRMLRKKILFPMIDIEKIQKVWKSISILSSDRALRSKIVEKLGETSDLNRLLSRFTAGKVYPRDFKTILLNVELVKELSELLKKLDYSFDTPSELMISIYNTIRERISEGELPAILGGDGRFLKSGYSLELDKARAIKSEGKNWILDLEESEKKKTGIGTMKIKFNKVVGYFIELSRKDAALVPSYYLKKQTLVGSERFTLPELEDIERNILQANEIIAEIELKEFNELIQLVLKGKEDFLNIANQLAELDYLLSLSICKDKYNWIQPEWNTNGELILEESRHPIVEKHLKIGEKFIANSVYLNQNKQAIGILTGPNMAGKSTYMRQIAICQILFQMGSFVPARSANLSIVDRIFTRIGSGDNLTMGESTFFVEMKETAHILRNRTEHSLILFDEIGRGTSTYDGLSLAWAIVEHLCRVSFDGKRTKTIFATHYHELTELEKEPGVVSLYMDTREKDGEIIFLKKVKTGKARKSFGIYVAKLAGVPFSIVDRSAEILANLESKKKEIKYKPEEERMLFSLPTNGEEPSLKLVKEKLLKLNPDNLSPREALDTLYELKKMINSF
jgi:DNA mismatch repair protein MutS